jgi:molecular chaperone DnaK
MQASMKLGEAMYKASQAEGAAPGAGPDAGPSAAGGPSAGAAKDEKVVDATFEDLSDKNKKG